MRALIDGDIILHRVGYSSELETVDVAIWRGEELVQQILSATKATDHTIYFSPPREETFRAKMCPEYKAHRVQEKPVHYMALKQFLTSTYNTQQEVDQEADDALGIAQANADVIYTRTLDDEGNQIVVGETVICSIDKDLLQIPGHHYNFVKGVHSFVTPEEGLLFFYKQMLIGDVADNVKGVGGIGQAKAAKLLDPLLGAAEIELFQVVQEAYRNWLEKEWLTDADAEWGDFQEKQMNNLILLTGRLLKIRTTENEIWNFPLTFAISPETTPQL